VQNGMQDEAFCIFIAMLKEDIKPNCFTMTSLLSGCSVARYAEKGKVLHGQTLL